MFHAIPEIGFHLFWVTTADRHGNWFVIARTARVAASFFEEHEGYTARAAKAEIIASIPSSLRPANGPSPCFAQIGDLRKVNGIEIIDDGKTSGIRKVRLNKRIFIEGEGIESLVTADITLPEDSSQIP
jgi:hypothetical protein